MYPTFSDLLNGLFGINILLPIKTYGFFVALAFITGTLVLSFELKRKEKEGLLKTIKKKVLIGDAPSIMSIVISALIGFILGYKILDAIFNYKLFVDDTQGFVLSSRGSFIGGILGAILVGGYTYWEKKKKQLPKPRWEEQTIHPYELSGNILVIAGISGILGAKLFHNLEYFDEFLKNPIEALISFSGLTFFGGFIVAISVVLWYCKKNGIKPLYVADAAAPVMAISYAVGRLGCHLSGDGCWGVVNSSPKPDWLSFLPDWLWAYKFPHNVINEGVPIPDCSGHFCKILDQPVFPTSLYEVIMMSTIFLIMCGLRKRIKIPGLLFSIFLILQAFERFSVESIRVNVKYHLFGSGITQAELISFLFFVIGVTGVVLTLKYKEKLKTLQP